MDMKSSSPKDIKQGTLFLWLWRGYLRRHMWVLAIIVVLMMIEGSMVGGLAWMMQPLFDGVFVGGSKSQLWMVGGIVLGLFLIRGVLSVVHRVLMTKIAKQSVADLQNDLLRHLLQLDLSFFSRYAPGYLMERVNGDVQAVAGIWALLVRGAARDLIGLVSLFAVMLSIDWLWTVAALVGAPLLLFPSLVAQRYTRKQAVKAREVAANMATRLNEAFHGVGTIKLNGLERYYTDRYRVLTKRQIEVEVKTLFGTAVIPSLVDVMSGIGFACVIIYGGYEIISGAKTVGQFMAFFSALGLAFEPLRRLAGISGLINAASVSIQRMRDIFNHQPTLLGPDNPKPVQPFGDIEFKNVSLEFGETPVLRDVSFRAPAGKTTAIVGASGAGKTTIFNALTRPIARARSRSPVLPIRKLIPVPCGPASRWCRKTAYCLMKPLGKTSPLMRAIRTHRNSMRWSQRPMWAISCQVWPKVWIPKSGRAAQTYLAGSVNGSPSPARSCAIRRYCFWMKPPQHWTPNQRSWCKML
jgi:subfamily B ATP-binding cassette protein MsbA